MMSTTNLELVQAIDSLLQDDEINEVDEIFFYNTSKQERYVAGLLDYPEYIPTFFDKASDSLVSEVIRDLIDIDGGVAFLNQYVDQNPRIRHMIETSIDDVFFRLFTKDNDKRRIFRKALQ